MSRFKLSGHITLAIALLFAVGLTGCGSKKNAVTNHRTTAYHRPEQSIPTTRGNVGSTTAGNLRDDQQRLVDEALSWLGAPYRYGGEDRKGVDCSGLTMMTYKTALGLKIPRRSADQQKFCRKIKKSDLEIGDLVFFCTGRDKNAVSHVGIYLGDNQFIHASSTKGVIISSIADTYFTRTYHSSGHVARKGEAKPQPAPETQPLQFEFDDSELDRAIESRIDSLMSGL